MYLSFLSTCTVAWDSKVFSIEIYFAARCCAPSYKWVIPLTSSIYHQIGLINLHQLSYHKSARISIKPACSYGFHTAFTNQSRFSSLGHHPVPCLVSCASHPGHPRLNQVDGLPSAPAKASGAAEGFIRRQRFHGFFMVFLMGKIWENHGKSGEICSWHIEKSCF